ncbi:MAG: redoxin domain-containing protein [Fuerstiella sp.]
MSKQSNKAEAQQQQGTQPRSVGAKIFLGILVGIALLYGVVLAYHVRTPMPSDGLADADILEMCRQYCAKYGLVSTGDLKADAEAYLEAVDSRQMSASLQELLSDEDFQPVATEDHPLIGKSAPDFSLSDTQDARRSLSDLNRNAPVILVFYYGYNCSHCVAQLFALQKDLSFFHELGAEVVAVSSDQPAYTRKQYAEYGDFFFPVLSDPDLSVSEAWGVYVRRTDDQQENMLHGTFVIDRDGRVVFANRGYEPFVDNRSLLHWLKDAASAEVSSTQVAASGRR